MYTRWATLLNNIEKLKIMVAYLVRRYKIRYEHIKHTTWVFFTTVTDVCKILLDSSSSLLSPSSEYLFFWKKEDK